MSPTPRDAWFGSHRSWRAASSRCAHIHSLRPQACPAHARWSVLGDSRSSLITNCPRYIPRIQRLDGSRYVPDSITGEAPIPGWKRIDAIQGVLPKRDQGQADRVGGIISMDEWGGMVADGNPLA